MPRAGREAEVEAGSASLVKVEDRSWLFRAFKSIQMTSNSCEQDRLRLWEMTANCSEIEWPWKRTIAKIDGLTWQERARRNKLTARATKCIFLCAILIPRRKVNGWE